MSSTPVVQQRVVGERDAQRHAGDQPVLVERLHPSGVLALDGLAAPLLHGDGEEDEAEGRLHSRTTRARRGVGRVAGDRDEDHADGEQCPHRDDEVEGVALAVAVASNATQAMIGTGLTAIAKAGATRLERSSDVVMSRFRLSRSGVALACRRQSWMRLQGLAGRRTHGRRR